MGAVGDKAVDVSQAAQELVGGELTKAAMRGVARAVADAVEIGPSSHAGVDYRREMVAVLAAPRAARGRRAGRRRGPRDQRTPAMSRHQVSIEINGRFTEAWVDPNLSLLELLRDEGAATEVKLGCGEGVCGTCTVLLDGEPVNSCLMFAVQADGSKVTTVRGLAPRGRVSPAPAGASWTTPGRSAASARPG